MRNRNISLLLVMSLMCTMMLLCSGCTGGILNGILGLTGANRVPDSVVLRNIEIPDGSTYEIAHDYDAAAHIDDVQVTVRYEGEYGTRMTTYTYAYQYNRETDLWSLIAGGNGIQSDVVTLNEEKYSNAFFSGKFKQAHSGTYELQVEKLDLTNGTIKVKYLIMIDNSSTMLSATETFRLQATDDNLGYYFEIPYTQSIVVKFSVVFVLNMRNGIFA